MVIRAYPPLLKKHSLYQESLLSLFFEAVIQGNIKKAETIITLDPTVVFKKSHVTDPTGREFNNISAFQYALWSLDVKMWQMIMLHMPHDETIKQYQALKSKSTAHGKHYDFSPLHFTMNRYIEQFNNWNHETRELYWCISVGGFQQRLPAHIVRDYYGYDNSHQHPTTHFYHLNLGKDFGMIRSFNNTTLCKGKTQATLNSAIKDLENLQKLFEQVNTQFQKLEENLVSKVTLHHKR